MCISTEDLILLLLKANDNPSIVGVWAGLILESFKFPNDLSLMMMSQANPLMEILETLGFCPKELGVKVPS